MNLKLWKRKKVEIQAIGEPEPVVLTGIQKWELEQEEAARVKAAHEHQEWRASIQRRIAELEAEIGPQMQELAQLRVQLNPWTYYSQLLSAQAQNAMGFGGIGIQGLMGKLQ